MGDAVLDTPKESRRKLLMETAETLFASKGIDAVSLNEINKAAGQRNTSAIHYHFGNKQGLIQAIVYEHYADIDRQINELLDAYEALPEKQQNTRDLIRALITPFTRQLDTDKGVNYLLIVRQILMKSSDMLITGHPDGEDRARPRVFGLFQQLMQELPAEIRLTRTVLCAGLIFNTLATYAESANADVSSMGSKALFISSLLDALDALLNSPTSNETKDIIAATR